MQLPLLLGLRARILVSVSALVIAASCGGGGGGGGAAVSPLVVIATSPSDGALDVPLNSRVTMTFSLALDPTSVHPASAVTVGNFSSGLVSGSCAISPDGTGRTIEFTPTATMTGGVSYGVTAAATLRSTAGDVLGGPRTFVFYTVPGVALPPETALRETVGTLDTGRRNHTATLLLDGSVLLCGGFIQGTTITDRAERFDPSSELFTLIPARMRQPRAGFTATRLLDGRVLLAGGYYEVSSGTLNVTGSAELYDPATKLFTDTGSMAHARSDHAALRLPDGRVLVTGGSELLGGFLSDHATAEVFSPTTGTWSPWASSMIHTRSSHQMVDALDGRWLLVGGSDVDLRPEMFDTATGVFTPFSAAAADRARFGAAAASFASGNVSVIGGEQFGDVLFFHRGFTQLINTGSGTTRPRTYATATRITPDWVLVAGGIDIPNGSAPLSSCDVVVEGGVAGSGTYASAMHFATGMADHTATLLADGRVLFAGGWNPIAGQPQLGRGYLFKNP
jgi:hypothetical protein